MRFSRGRNAVTTAAALAIVSGVGRAAAQEPDRELTATFYEPLKVRLVNVNVVATDSDGVPIRGLTESDFEIFEDGQTVEISHFLAADPQAGGVVGDEARTAPDEALQPAAESHVAQISVASVVRDEQSSIESTKFVDVEVGNVTGETGR